jgi:hypothetical protein
MRRSPSTARPFRKAQPQCREKWRGAIDREKTPLTSAFSVELPGIEPAAKWDMACGNAEFDYPKRRESA